LHSRVFLIEWHLSEFFEFYSLTWQKNKVELDESCECLILENIDERKLHKNNPNRYEFGMNLFFFKINTFFISYHLFKGIMEIKNCLLRKENLRSLIVINADESIKIYDLYNNILLFPSVLEVFKNFLKKLVMK
jgi:hypothetical protein